MARPGPPYSPEFRAEAVRLLRSSGKTVAELSRELGVSEQTLRNWRRQAAVDRGESAGVITDERSRLQRFTLNPRGEDRSVRILARLTAEAIDVGIAVVTAPARWAAKGLRCYADQKDHPPPRASTGPDTDAPVGAG